MGDKLNYPNCNQEGFDIDNLQGLWFGLWYVIEYAGNEEWKCRCLCGKEEYLHRDVLINRTKESCGHNSRVPLDFSGTKINSWEVIEKRPNRMFLCRCSCGKVKEVAGYSLKIGASKSCGHSTDPNIGKENIKKGDVFGEWTVISDVDDKYRVLCKCSCGKTRKVSIYTLQNKESTSCGHTMNQDRALDLTGRQFGDLTALRRMPDGTWECRCSCNKIVYKRRDHLLDGRSHSCGHGTSKEPEDLKGRRFGKLTVKEYMGSKSWLCECECGNRKIISSANLKNNSTVSCGCLYYKTDKDIIISKCEQFNNTYGRMPSVLDLAQIEGINPKTMRYHLDKLELTGSKYLDTKYASQGERELYRFICSITDKDVLHNVNNVIYPNELDIYIPDEKIAFEYNGTYWHSVGMKDEDYHQEKTLACAQKGIQLIHIFEYEWKNDDKRKKIEEIIRLRLDKSYGKAVYARDLTVCEEEAVVVDSFCDKYHIQCKATATINIVLKNSDGTILGAMTFGKPRFNASYEYELVRLVYAPGYKIVGGAERMFKFFIKKYNASTIISYCNASKFIGQVYINLGFLYDGMSKPNYVWVSEHGDNVLTRYQSVKASLIDKGLGQENETEFEIMSRLGYYKVCDSGNLRFTWNK